MGGREHLEAVKESLAAALRPRLWRPRRWLDDAIVFAAVAAAREPPPYEEQPLPLRAKQSQLSIEPSHPVPLQLRVVLEDEESGAVIVAPAADDVLEERVVAEIRADRAPARDGAEFAPVEPQVSLHASLEVATVRLKQARAPPQSWPALEAYAR